MTAQEAQSQNVSAPPVHEGIRLEKVVINIGVGKSGEPLEKAKAVLKAITGSKKIWERKAKDTIRDFGVRKNDTIAVAVTLRGKDADAFLRRGFKAMGMKLKSSSVSGRTFSAGITEHILLPGAKYDPKLGVFGMDITTTLERPGYRVARRKRRPGRIGKRAAISSQDTIDFISSNYGVEVV
ncbi:MAG TPA: 50S ribosomal protein L5 [Thermoproteota archaeon]|nr:50S ribosomal protein L5 [Thermoproteota archaeon]